MAVETATVIPLRRSAALAADRRLHRRRPISYFAWLGLGAIGTYVDRIHEWLGVVAYPHQDWIGEALPVSPVYMAAAVAFFLIYTVIVGHRGRSQGLFGGRPLTFVDVVVAHVSWIVVYALTGYLGASGGPWPWVAIVVLAGVAAPDLWLARRTWLPLYCGIVAVVGVGFEWLATWMGGFVYPVCPAAPCLGTTVPAAWLGMLYVHAALYVHRMLGGRHPFRGSPVPRGD